MRSPAHLVVDDTTEKHPIAYGGGGRSRRARVSTGPPWVPMTSADPEDRKREESALRGSDLGQRSRICFVAVVATSCIFEKFSQNLWFLNSSCPVARLHRALSLYEMDSTTSLPPHISHIDR